MESRLRLFGHSVHQMLVPFAVGLFGAAAVFDALALVTSSPMLFRVAYWLVGASVVAGVVVAPFGAIDWAATPADSRAERIGRLHAMGNVIVLLLLAASWGMRRGNPENPWVAASVLSFAAVAIALFTAWLGGELVSRLGVGVSEHAGPNARSSLDGPALAEAPRPAPTQHYY